MPSVGAGVEAPPKQTYPALQKPEGAVSPGAAQYAPALHGEQPAAVARPLTLENVETGHGHCIAADVPAGQK